MAKLDAVIFDLDGTLIDSAPDIANAVNRLMVEIDAPTVDVATVQCFIGNGAQMLMARVRAHHNLKNIEVDELTKRFKRLYEEAPSAHTIVYDGVRDALFELSTKGLKLGICTNKPEIAARMILDDLALSQFFDVVIGGDTVGALKPNPASLRAAMKALDGNAETTAYIGDSEIDMQTAHAADVPFYFFEGGYCHIPNSEIEAAAHLKTFFELPKMLL